MATLEIFDVEHGQCSLLSSDSGAHMLVDCGHNGGTGWRPSRMLSARSIRHLDELVITNYLDGGKMPASDCIYRTARFVPVICEGEKFAFIVE